MLFAYMLFRLSQKLRAYALSSVFFRNTYQPQAVVLNCRKANYIAVFLMLKNSAAADIEQLTEHPPV